MKKISLITILISMGLLLAGCSGEASKTPETTGTQGTSIAGSDASSGGGGEIGGEITVSSYDSAMYQAFLEEAAQLFEQQYPGTKVNIESFAEMPQVNSSDQDGEQIQAIIAEDDSQGRADYISKTSTALMSGQGADLLAMDVLPIQKYVESGQLENLEDYMSSDSEFDKADYRSNILDALKLQNGVWFLPLDYSFDYYSYDETLIDGQFGVNQVYTTSELIELGITAFDGTNKIIPAPAYLKSGSGDLFSQLFDEYYREFVDVEGKAAHFTDGTFKELIEYVQELADNGYINKGLGQGDASDLLKSATEAPTERFQFKIKNQFSLVQQTYPDSDFRMAIATTEVDNGIEEDDQIAGACSEADGTVPFTYDMAFGINANSSNKETAWAFLKFLLSYEVQSSPNMSVISLPVHNQARKDRAETLYRMLLTGGEDLDESQALALSYYVDAVEALSDQMNGYTIKDTTIQDMVLKELEYFFDGSKTSDQVCEVLQNRVGLYLSE